MSKKEGIKTIAIDLDSVLADTMVVWTNQYNKLNHTEITKNDITLWDIGKLLPLSSNEISKIFTYIWKNLWFDIPTCEPRLPEITRRIHSKGYRISVLTKRERPTVEYVAKWLDYHDIFSNDLIFVYDNMPKAGYPFDILVDDAPVNLIDIVPPKKGVLFNQPWNKNFQWPIRVNTLREVEEDMI